MIHWDICHHLLFKQNCYGRSGLTWDDPLPIEHTNRRLKITEDLQNTISVKIPRYCFMSGQLHVFADASMKAYGAIAFLRFGEHTSFVLARSCVAPLKTHTLPKLELMAAIIASRLAQFVLSSLCMNCRKSQSNYGVTAELCFIGCTVRNALNNLSQIECKRSVRHSLTFLGCTAQPMIIQ